MLEKIGSSVCGIYDSPIEVASGGAGRVPHFDNQSFPEACTVFRFAALVVGLKTGYFARQDPNIAPL